VIGGTDPKISHEDTGYTFEEAMEIGLVNALNLINVLLLH
jgi:hypothetical protein